MASPISADGRLLDFEPLPGDEPYSLETQHRGSSRRRRWGNRVLLAVEPQNNPNLGGQNATKSATLIDTGDLGRCVPINIQVRFALVNPTTGAPILPLRDINSPVGSLLDPPVKLTLNVRRGVDENSTITEDIYTMPSLNQILDSAPFDTITTRSLGLDVAISQDGATPAQQRISNVWIEAVATIVDQVGVRDTLPGYVDLNESKFTAASSTRVVLAQQHVSRCQFFLVNTSKNADLYVLFGNSANPSTTLFTIVLPKGGANVYESPLGGWAGDLVGFWVGSPLDGGAMFSGGSYKSANLP